MDDTHLHVIYYMVGKDENITTNILVKICNALNCELHEIMELSHEDESNVKSLFVI